MPVPLSILGRKAGDGDMTPLFRQGGPRGVLCLHGFTGTPFEVRPLAEALASQGFTVSAPLLAGHGTTTDDLAHTHWPDWLRSAEVALAKLSAAVAGGPVAIAGFSMGALLALRLARLRPEVAALVVMSAPLRLRPFHVTAVRALASLPRLLRRGPIATLPKLRGYDVADQQMQGRNPGLLGMPLAGVVSLLELAEMVRRDLPAIRVPTLVAHGTLDRTVPFGDSLELAGTIGSDVIERLWLRRSGHLIGIDVERTALSEAVARFLLTRLPHPRAGAGASAPREVIP